jgi:CRISPR-associated endonuclease/helicase Cas3
MTPEDFATFYGEVHGYPPFPWQERLLTEVVSNGWPDSIDLPTSSGKTSAIDVAIFHLAMEAESRERRAPLRIFFVIDRRVVVDEAAEHAKKIAIALRKPTSEAVARVAKRLSSFGGDLPLGVSVLRGGMYRDSTWADEPNQPLVCVSTVDQIGSRLLFRGYQTGEGSRPVHAALVGNDSLMFIDEAHLSKPFLDTLSAVTGRYSQAQQKLSIGMTVVPMSATLGSGKKTFRLAEPDLSNPVLKDRYSARKFTELVVPKKTLEDEVVRKAREFSKEAGVAVIGIVVNTVRSARAVFNELVERHSLEAVLLTGRNRPYSSARLWQEYKPRIEANPNRVDSGQLFVVATQTVEVGANLDFDALVTEAAPLDALQQRFGRLDRLGRRKTSKAAIIQRPGGDLVYKEATTRTWDYLLTKPDLDFGISGMRDSLNDANIDSFRTERSSAPLLFPAHLEFLVQTSPTPDPDPDIAPFLHGPDALETADVQIVWRADLPIDPDQWEERVALAPPHSTEALSMPIGAVKRWLRGEGANVSDIEGISFKENEAKRQSEMRTALIWNGPRSDRNSTDPRRIRPGQTIVVPSAYGGCDRFGWNGESNEPVEDIGDAANNALAEMGLRTFRARIAILAAPIELKRRAVGSNEDDPDEDAQAELAHLAGAPPQGRRFDVQDGLITWPGRKLKERWRALPDETDEDDTSSVGREQKAISLKVHTDGVEKRAQRYAQKCGLSDAFVSDIALAARLHDLGKWDERFQAWLNDGSIIKALSQPEPLAKSGGRRNPAEVGRMRERAGYPKDGRHEAASVMIADLSIALNMAHDRELVLYLIGVHHGFGRPLFPVWSDQNQIRVIAKVDGEMIESTTGRELARFDSGWVDRFWRLNKQFGYWGLAYLETILRRADCMQSRVEQQSE